MDLSSIKISLSDMSDEELYELMQETRKGRRTPVESKTRTKTKAKKKSSIKHNIDDLEALLAKKLKEEE